MIIAELIRDAGIRLRRGDIDAAVAGISCDSRTIRPGELFVCVNGYETDGHHFIREAVQKQAGAVLLQEAEFEENIGRTLMKEIPEGVAVLTAPNTRIALARVSAAFYRYPAKELQLIGVTGTKGKTTTAYMIRAGLEMAGYQTGMIGTIEIDTGKRVIQPSNTTPESVDVQRYLREMADAGCKIVVMEVSSQALKLHRTEGLWFQLAVFTNLGVDHIGPGEHADIQEYLQCKRRLFLQAEQAVGNQEDRYLSEIWRETDCKKITYAAGITASGEADYQCSEPEYTEENGKLGIRCQISGKLCGALVLSMPGRYNASNGLAAAAVLREMGVPGEFIFAALKEVQVPGRMEQILLSGNGIALIDYAHNAMSLEAALKALREYGRKRIVTIFGCGGNRSPIRRAAMGKAAGSYADLVILTTDNPRYEEPEKIMKEIERGLSETETPYIMITDRAEAIGYAVRNCRPGDVILVAGKGHENYQEIRGIRYPMDDKELVKTCMQM